MVYYHFLNLSRRHTWTGLRASIRARAGSHTVGAGNSDRTSWGAAEFMCGCGGVVVKAESLTV